MRHFKSLLLALSMLFFGTLSAVGQNGSEIVGVYKAVEAQTNKLSHIEFYRVGDTYEAKIIWLEAPEDAEGKPLYDIKNPNPELRKVKADSIKLVWGIKYDPNKKLWKGGTVYSPMEGKSYDVQINFEGPNKLKLRGFIGTPMLGKNIFWEKIK